MMSGYGEAESREELPRLSFRNATREDSGPIIALLNATFRTQLDQPTWEWFVYGNPNGPSRVYLAQDTAQTIVGVIAFAPFKFLVQGKPVMGDFAHHLALQRTYRDTLSYFTLTRLALQSEAYRGINFIIGPPNPVGYRVHKTMLKWVDFGFLDCLRKMSPCAKAHGCKQVSFFSEAFDRFYHSVSSNLSFCVDKNSTWMNWRFCQRPGRPYTVYLVHRNGEELAGYVILKRWQEPDGYRKAHIVDLHARDGASLSELMAAAESYAVGSDELNLWAIQGYPYRAALEAIGFGTAGAPRQPLLARSFTGSPLKYPEGAASLAYGDGDTLY